MIHTIKSALNANMRGISVISNNIANSNTTAFKKSNSNFSDVYSHNKLVDINTMMFVAIHEMGHLASKEIGHVPPFWDNMKFLLEVGIELGIYSKTDYAAAPVSYCGTKITDTPLDL